MNMASDDDALSADDQEPPQGPFNHLRRGSEPLFANSGMVLWWEPKPGRKILRSAEGLGRRRKGCDGRGDQRTDTGHRH